jgi:rhodanese-related sulfurtransferase
MEHSERFLRLVESAKAHVREVSVAEVKRRLDLGEPFELVDVREESEWSAGRLPSARHLGKGILERDVEKAIPLLTTEIVLYCGGGYRSILAAEQLQKMGYSRVSSMVGGYRGWNEAGLPVLT